MINCKAGGDCNGGDPAGVYEYAYTKGIPDSSCMNYIANNLEGKCTDFDICRDCKGPAPEPDQTGFENCWAVDFRHFYVKNYFEFGGALKMKAELFKQGPISCGIDVTDNFEKYTGGIYSEHKAIITLNHEISIVGYGLDADSGKEYWIGRNSWGTYWGEQGYFRI
jgi:cathepsin X